MVLNHIQLGRGRLDEAEAAIRRTLELNPAFSPAHYFLGIVLLARGRPDAALAEFLRGRTDWGRMAGSAMAYFALGRKTDSDTALAQMLKTETRHPYIVAQIFAFRGETDEAFKWLDQAAAQKDPALVLLKSQAMFMKLEGDPRYKAFLRKVNLPD
jgi:adenylate cyclase